MLKKGLLISMVSALAISASSVAFAMKEDQDKRPPSAQRTVAFFPDSHAEEQDRAVLPDELCMHILSFLPGDELRNAALVSKCFSALVRERSLQAIIRRHNVQVTKDTIGNSNLTKNLRSEFQLREVYGRSVDTKFAEEVLGLFQTAMIKHIEYGFTPQFIKKMFNPDAIKEAIQTGYNIASYKTIFLPLGILAVPFEAGPKSPVLGKHTDLPWKLTAVFENHPAFQNCESNFHTRVTKLTYETHFGTIFHFIEGMSETQRESTISLLLPHMSLKNFANFYPHQLIKGMDKYNVSNLNGDKKIKWLRRKLKDCGFYPPKPSKN